MNSSPSPVKSAGTGSSSSTFSSASTSVPAATSPTSGTWRTGRRSIDGARVRVPPHLDGTRLGRVAAQVAEALQRVEVAVHRGRGREADGLADLADRRRVAALAHLQLDEVEHLALAGGDLGPGRPERRARGWRATGCRSCCLGFRHERHRTPVRQREVKHSFCLTANGRSRTIRSRTSVPERSCPIARRPTPAVERRSRHRPRSRRP